MSKIGQSPNWVFSIQNQNQNQIGSSMELGGDRQMSESSDEKTDFKLSPAQPGYGLRENPRKTWRSAEDLETPPLIEEQKSRICKQCGKGFKSMKALCGHMACHSEKDRFFKEDYSWTSERVDRENSVFQIKDQVIRPKREATKRIKKPNLCSLLLDNDSSSVSEIDFELEEVAMCLITLSKDYRSSCGIGVDSNHESSDSVVLETTKSSSFDTKVGLDQQDGEFAYKAAAEIKKLEKGKSKSRYLDSENEDSSNEYFTINEFKKQKSESGGSRFKVYNADELRIGFDKNGRRSDSKIMKLATKNTVKKLNKSKKKKTKAHECPYCNRVFKSGQAFGGHKRSHFLGNSGNKNNQITTVFETETSEEKELIDLNLPAPEQEEEK